MATLNTTTASALPASATAGTAYYITDNNKFVVYTGSSWHEVHADAAGTPYVNRWSAFGPGVTKLSGSTTIDLVGAKTLSFWFKASPSTTAYSGGFSALSDGSNSGTSYFGYVYYGRIINAGSTSYYFAPASDPFVEGSWYHVAITSSGGSGSTDLKIYLNGDLKAEKPNRDQTGITHVGGASAHTFDSFFDECAVFDYELTQSQVHDLRGLTAPGLGTPADLSTFATQPIYWWRFGDESGASPTDGGDIISVANSGTAGSAYDLTTAGVSSYKSYGDLTGESIYV